MNMALRDIVPWSRGKAPGAYRGTEGNPVLGLYREMNRAFDDFFRGDLFRGFDDLVPSLGRSTGWPQTDLVETDKQYRVTAELPGLEEKDVEITLHDNVLTLKGEKTIESGGDAVYAERYHGKFQRSIALGDDIDRDKVTASFKNGVLTVVVPKNPQAATTAKRIPISAA
jgi:HSP20 family protein